MASEGRRERSDSGNELIQSEERDIIGGGAQSFAKMSFIAEVTERTSWGLKMLEFLGTDDLLYSNNYY